MSNSSDIRPSTVSSHAPREKRSYTISVRNIVSIAVVILLCVASFFIGLSYQKSHTKVTTASAATSLNTNTQQKAGGFGGRRNGGFGQVTAVSATSITIQNERTGASTTYSITSSTTITDSGQATTSSDIQVGDTVIISVASTGSTTATSISVNPSFGGGAASGSSQETPNGASGTDQSVPLQSD